ncbi:hypothetical protein SBX64_19470 [Vibrio rhizosphaerae]|uniref:DUF4234 domain-containing protein n=1 Tax=Vibrio rhizosphaerae TaxID=398736 RepID=A0ABU4J1Q8_9VIBR|nr:hypothetical protein [Vibrio rhizosphaerae]MDW6094729.1 hypothetical protein [Vibrio rhizosphaerae]
MIKLITTASIFAFLFSGISYIFLIIYISIILKNQKEEIIQEIIHNAPDKFRDRARLQIYSNFSWVFASSTAFTWYGYIMLRYAWKIPIQDIQLWKNKINEAYGSYYKLYNFSTYLVNIWLVGLPIACIGVYIQ